METATGGETALEPVNSLGSSSGAVRTCSVDEFTTIWALQRSKFAWLLGAGTSASAGVPLATSIRDRLLFDRYAVEQQLVRQTMDDTDPAWVQRVHTYFDGKNGMPRLGSDGDYSAAFERCLPDESARKALLRELIEHVRPGFGQRIFGGLVMAGACDLVITTNFDRLIEQGINEAGRAGTAEDVPLPRELNVAGLDSTARATTAIQERQWPLVLKLHGDFREKRLKNTTDELQREDATLRQFVADVSRQFGIAISGYSGRDTCVMEMLEATVDIPGAWPYGVWWFTRPGEQVSQLVRSLLARAADNGVAATVVVADSFDDTMAALARQVHVEDTLRQYLDRLHPKPRRTPAALPAHSRQWPVLRFNALPVLEASVEVTRVEIPAGWTRSEVRRALHPRNQWPVVVNGPGEMLCLGDPHLAVALLADAANQKSLPAPGPATTAHLNLLADDTPFHQQTLLRQVVAHLITQRLPVRMQTSKDGTPELIITPPADGEPAAFGTARAQLADAYAGQLYGSLPKNYGLTATGLNRRWAEEVRLSFDIRAGRSWLLFTPYTWIAEPARDLHAGPQGATANGAAAGVGTGRGAGRRGSELGRTGDDGFEVDPANPWRAEVWAKRRFNEKWAAIIGVWSGLLAPDDATVLTSLPQADSGGRPSVRPGLRIVLGRTNAYSRPA
ncbi:SIR2 family protein [Nocardioides caricicola]|uniref:SIR2 family protein n=1 Tax=Nocardioides caricicola TaxID=634770 RepID=A0ABW0N2H6_9ACTN